MSIPSMVTLSNVPTARSPSAAVSGVSAAPPPTPSSMSWVLGGILPMTLETEQIRMDGDSDLEDDEATKDLEDLYEVLGRTREKPSASSRDKPLESDDDEPLSNLVL